MQAQSTIDVYSLPNAVSPFTHGKLAIQVSSTTEIRLPLVHMPPSSSRCCNDYWPVACEVCQLWLHNWVVTFTLVLLLEIVCELLLAVPRLYCSSPVDTFAIVSIFVPSPI
jgi:hypothetical protein